MILSKHKNTYLRDGRAPVPKKEATSRVMSANKNKNTKPELLFRKLLYRNGLKGYRLNYKALPGSPDIFFPKQKIVIFIDGCFWHGCKKCYSIPKTNKNFWETKIETNIKRDRLVNIKLQKNNIKVMRIWEHKINSKQRSNNNIKKLTKLFFQNI